MNLNLDQEGNTDSIKISDIFIIVNIQENFSHNGYYQIQYIK